MCLLNIKERGIKASARTISASWRTLDRVSAMCLLWRKRLAEEATSSGPEGRRRAAARYQSADASRLLRDVNIETLVRHYREHELPDIFRERKPRPGTAEEDQKAYSTQYAYGVYLKRWILPRWRSYRLIDVKRRAS